MACAAEEEAEAVLLLAEVLLRSKAATCRAFAATLYATLFGGCDTLGTSERVVCSVAERVLSVSSTPTEVEVRPQPWLFPKADRVQGRPACNSCNN